MRVFLQVILVDFILVIRCVFDGVATQEFLVFLERLLIEILVDLAVEMRAFVLVRLALFFLFAFFLRFLRFQHPGFNALAALYHLTVDFLVHQLLLQFFHVLDDFVETVVADLSVFFHFFEHLLHALA